MLSLIETQSCWQGAVEELCPAIPAARVPARARCIETMPVEGRGAYLENCSHKKQAGSASTLWLLRGKKKRKKKHSKPQSTQAKELKEWTKEIHLIFRYVLKKLFLEGDWFYWLLSLTQIFSICFFCFIFKKNQLT